MIPNNIQSTCLYLQYTYTIGYLIKKKHSFKRSFKESYIEIQFIISLTPPKNVEP